MEKYGFVYIWRDKGKDRYYIGAHWGDVNDGYICSSTWMRNSYRRRPNDFRRKILSKVFNREMLFEEEHKWLMMIKDEDIGTRYYNLQKYLLHWSSDPDARKTVGEKISKRLKGVYTGENHHNFGKHASQESKQRMTESHVGQIPWNKGISSPSPMEGKTHTEESKQKIREQRALQIITEEHKQNISNTLKGRPKPPRSPEHSKAISDAKMGKPAWNKGINGYKITPHSEEHCQALSGKNPNKSHPAWNKGRKQPRKKLDQEKINQI